MELTPIAFQVMNIRCSNIIILVSLIQKKVASAGPSSSVMASLIKRGELVLLNLNI